MLGYDVLSDVPLLRQWEERMQDDDAVRATRLPTKQHLAYLASHAAGKPNFDTGLDNTLTDVQAKL